MDFNSILQQAQKLANEVTTAEDLPRVERSIPQVLQDAQDLHSRLTQTGAQDIQAQFLLSSKGFDLPKISQKLETLNTKKTFRPLQPIADTDIQSFLKNEKENAILSVIEEVHKSSYESAQKQKWEKIKNDWRIEKMKLLNALVGPSQNWIDIQKMPEQTVLNETTSGGRSSLNRIEMAYAREVYDYNKCITEGALRPNLVLKFAKVAETFNDPKVSEIWEIMKYMVNVTPLSRTQDPIQSRSQMTQFIDQAKKYLESRYKLYMSTVISANLKDARKGGVPSTFNLVAAFVDLTFHQNLCYGLQDKLIDGKPLWPMVYYCLRCGDFQSALKCLQMTNSGHEEIIQALEEKIKNPNQKVNSKLEGQLKMQYKCQIKNSTDPYKKAVYCVITGCDATEQHSEIAKTTDDFLWIQLSLLRSDPKSTDDLTLSSLQIKILEEYGEKYFNASDQKHLYFQVLALTGQFEAAIEFLSRTERYRVHAVHIAIALNEMFLIGGPRNVQEPLLSIDIEDPLPMRRLNIARLIMLYVQKFEITDPAEAIQYYFFLRNLKDPEGKNLFLVSVADLAIESCEFDLIFGKMQPNGLRSRGLFDQFESIEFDTKTAANLLAEELIKKGMFEDAVKLFDIAGDYGQALRYLSTLLSQVVHNVSKPGTLRERLQVMCSELTERLKGEDINCDLQILSTFNLLQQLLQFFDYYHDKKYQLALEILTNTKLIPTSTDDLEMCINNFKRLSPEVCKIYPDLLLATMNILHLQYQMVKGKDSIMDGGKERQLAYYRERAKAITNMAATVPYRMPGDINSKLVLTEILMH